MDKWTEEEKNIVQELRNQRYSINKISDKLREKDYHRTSEAIECFLRRNKKKNNIKVKTNEENITDTLIKIKQRKEQILDTINNKFNRIGKIEEDYYRIVSVSDLHIPFENESSLTFAIRNSSYNDILVINGDFFDCFSVSKWPKEKQYLLKHEYEIAFMYLELLSKLYNKIVLVRGNHDYRIQSYFHAKIDPAVSFLVHEDVLERMSTGYSFDKDGNFKKIRDFKNIIYQPGPCSWYAKLGKTIFAHPSKALKIPMASVVDTADYFLDKEDFQCIVMGHTHKIGKTIWKNKLLIEQGCNCISMAYEAHPKLEYGTQSFGHCIIIMDKDGNVDFNRSNPIYYGTATIVNKENLL